MSMPAVSDRTAALEWHIAAAPMPGENVLGDHAVVAVADGCAVAAAVDGLGHGAQAAAAAEAAASVLARSAGQNPAAVLLDCHRALHDTRGAALSLASIDLREHKMAWLGVGNVEARLLHGAEPVPPTESLLLHAGIVGHALPRLSTQTMRIVRGDVLIFVTDGIRRDFADSLELSGSSREIAERVLEQGAHGTDDALVLVVRYLARG
jgi:serine phosphatase RsbU (regulator of sigma subunit)